MNTSSSTTGAKESPKSRLVDLVAALLARGRVDEAIRYQVEVPLLLGIPAAEAMEKTVDEITEFMDSITPRPPPIPPGYTGFWWGPEA